MFPYLTLIEMIYFILIFGQKWFQDNEAKKFTTPLALHILLHSK